MLPGGERFDCAAGQRILNAAHAADILIPYSCRGGRCGTCRGRLVDGEIEYPQGLPEALDDEQAQQGYVLFCSAVALSDLTIELIRPGFDSDGPY